MITPTECNSNETVLEKYGPLKMARYLVRTFDDWSDVCETLNRRVQENVEAGDFEAILRLIECWAMSVPNTVSSVIVGFNVPTLIIEEQRGVGRVKRPMQIDPNGRKKPAILKSDKALAITYDVKNLLDLHVFNQFVHNPLALKTEGLDIGSVKRMMKVSVKKVEGPAANFTIIFTCPYPA